MHVAYTVFLQLRCKDIENKSTDQTFSELQEIMLYLQRIKSFWRIIF